jgi:hypothetical protein
VFVVVVVVVVVVDFIIDSVRKLLDTPSYTNSNFAACVTAEDLRVIQGNLPINLY